MPTSFRESRNNLLASEQKARDEARAKQLAALKTAVPPDPTERMRATIQLNKYKQPRIEEQRIKAKMTALQMTLFRSVLPGLVEVVPNATLAWISTDRN